MSRDWSEEEYIDAPVLNVEALKKNLEKAENILIKMAYGCYPYPKMIKEAEDYLKEKENVDDYK